MRFPFLSVPSLCLILALSATARADHRVALLIGNSKYTGEQFATGAPDLKAVAAALERIGFRCSIRENLEGKQLREVVERFANTTPTRGTALVYFAGRVLPGENNGKSDHVLVGTNAQADDPRKIGNAGYKLEDLIDTLDSRGGSSRNLVVLDAPDTLPAFDQPLPEGCSLAFGDIEAVAKQLSGKGSVAIAAPEKFVEGKHAGDEWVNSRGMAFCWCPPGKYVTGSPANEPGRYPDEEQREVVIPHGFWVSKYELTLSQNLRSHPRSTIATHKNHPLTMINLDDARRMTTFTLTNDERKAGRLADGWEYALPSEDQWEYAARAGTTASRYFGDDERQLPEHANFGDRSYYDSKDVYATAAHRTLDDGAVRLAVVGSYRPNPWGLHDVYGNVAEWCDDGSLRGGSWVSVPAYCRSAYRDNFGSRNEQNFIGYRLVIRKVVPKKPDAKK